MPILNDMGFSMRAKNFLQQYERMGTLYLNYDFGNGLKIQSAGIVGKYPLYLINKMGVVDTYEFPNGYKLHVGEQYIANEPKFMIFKSFFLDQSCTQLVDSLAWTVEEIKQYGCDIHGIPYDQEYIVLTCLPEI